MPRDRTSKYAVTITAPGYAFSPMLWLVRRDGRPTDANLAKFVESFEASTGPGGANAHLGAQRMTPGATVVVTSAVIRLNQAGGAVVARYQAQAAGGAMFTVVGGSP